MIIHNITPQLFKIPLLSLFLIYLISYIFSLSQGVKRPGREADHSPPSSADVKE
jgi:hypothetical protein